MKKKEETKEVKKIRPFMQLNDDELEQVSGGGIGYMRKCRVCGGIMDRSVPDELRCHCGD